MDANDFRAVFFLIILGIVAYYLIKATRVPKVILPFQKGLLYHKGKFIKVLDAGRYHILPGRSLVTVVDMRRNSMIVPGQDILTQDKINIKVSLFISFEVADPAKSQHSSLNPMGEMYNLAQIAVRDIIAAIELEAALEKQLEINTQITEKLKNVFGELGYTLHSVNIRDIILPPALKRSYAGLLEAKKEAQINLEKARGEQAVLRSLSNSSSMYDQNPSLLQARVIQAISTGSHTIVFGNDTGIVKNSPKNTG